MSAVAKSRYAQSSSLPQAYYLRNALFAALNNNWESMLTEAVFLNVYAVNAFFQNCQAVFVQGK